MELVAVRDGSSSNEHTTCLSREHYDAAECKLAVQMADVLEMPISFHVAPFKEQGRVNDDPSTDLNSDPRRKYGGQPPSVGFPRKTSQRA